MHRSSKAMLLATGCAAIATLTAQPATAGPFDRLKKIAEKVERKAAEAEEVRQRVESTKDNVDRVAEAIGIEESRQDAADGSLEDPAAYPCEDPQACDLPMSGGDPAPGQQQSAEDGWPDMEPADDMEGTMQ